MDANGPCGQSTLLLRVEAINDPLCVSPKQIQAVKQNNYVMKQHRCGCAGLGILCLPFLLSWPRPSENIGYRGPLGL